MIRFLFLLSILILVNCRDQKESQEDFRKIIFDVTTEALPSLPLGFSVFGNDLSKFVPRVFDKELNLISNPLLKHVSDSVLILLSGKYTTDPCKTYYFVSKIKVGNFFLLSLMQDDTSNTEYWMKLNLFSASGKLLDTITFAGQKVYHYEMYGILDKNLNIETRTYHNIEIDTTNPDKYHYNYYATEVKKRYIIQDTCFKLIEILRERALFTDVSDRKIVARVDTLKFHY